MSLTSAEAESIIAPLVKGYCDTFNSGQFDKMAQYYHKNSVMIEKDKSVLYGPQDIVKSLHQMATECGKTEMKLMNGQYEGVGDFVNMTTDFEFHTEKAGVLKGRFIHIWRKMDGVYAIYHDEYEML